MRQLGETASFTSDLTARNGGRLSSYSDLDPIRNEPEFKELVG
jgi:hypothetical protein